MPGGTAWKIVKDEEEIVYAVDYNNRPDRYVHVRVCMFTMCVCMYDCMCVCVVFV